MREFTTDAIDTVPEEIMLTDSEVIQLMGLEPDVGIKMAFAAGAHSMDELDAKERSNDEDLFSRFLEDVSMRIRQNRDMLDGISISAFDTTEDVVNVEAADSVKQYLGKATAWVEQNYKLIKSALALVSESLDKLADELEDCT